MSRLFKCLTIVFAVMLAGYEYDFSGKRLVLAAAYAMPAGEISNPADITENDTQEDDKMEGKEENQDVS